MPERYPDLHFSLIEFNAHWLASLVGGMDKCWVTGIGQDADWWLGKWDDTRPTDDQPNMAQLFRLNEKWPYPLQAERVRAAPVPRAVPGRPGGRRLPAHHRPVHARVGQRLPARRGHVPRQPGAHRQAVRRRPRRRAQGHPRRHPRRAPRLRAGRRSSRPVERAPLRRARRGRHRRRARHRPGLRAAARRRGAPASWSTTSAARWRATGADAGPAADGGRPRSRPPAARPSPTRSDVATRRGRAGAGRRRASTAFGRIDVAGQQRRDHALGRLPRGRRRRPRRPPRRARRRLVPHRPGGVAAPGRAGLRPHRDDDVDRACSACPATSPTPRPRAACIGLARSLATAGRRARHQGQLHRPRRHHPHGRRAAGRRR